MGRRRATVAVATALVLGAAGLPAVLTPAQAAPVGQGFTVTPSDLAYILKQIKIAEAHVANTTPATGPCGALLGTGPNQIPNPLLSYGLRTVDGSCNNLQPNRAHFGASGQVFPRHATESFRPAEDGAPAGQAGQTSYATKNTNVVDSQPRLISNLIVDQTAANPAAVAAATAPIRTQGSTGVFPCETPGVPAGCIPEGQTLDIPNVTTDVGLSPPFNAWFTLFGQFFDHGLDFTKKSHGAVIVPLRSDDPLLDGLDGIPGNADDPGPNERFMVLTRTENQPGPDGVLGTADDVKEGTNTDSPFVDQSQTYASHPSHQVFLRAYADNVEGKPVSTGKLLSTADGGLSPWSLVKSAAAADLGLRLVDRDVLDIPMLATDPYGRFLPGSNGLPQWVTAGPDGTPLTADDVLVEGDRANPVPAPADVNRIGTAFLDDIAHSAVPRQATPDQGPGRPARPALLPDGDSSITPAGGTQPAGTYDDEMLDAHFLAGDGRTNENIGLTAIHQVFHSEHDRLVDDIKNTLTTDTTAKGVVALPEWQSAPRRGRLERRAAVPGRPVRHRDGVPAPRVRGVRPQGAAGDQPVRGVPRQHQLRDPCRVRARGVPLRALDADRHDLPHQRGRDVERRQPVRRLPQPPGLLRRRLRRPVDRAAGGRGDRDGHGRPGRQRDRRVRHQHAAQQRARPAAGPGDHQHRPGPGRRRADAERVPPRAARSDPGQPAHAVRQLARVRAAAQAPAVAGQLHRGLRRPSVRARCRHDRRQAGGRPAAGRPAAEHRPGAGAARRGGLHHRQRGLGQRGERGLDERRRRHRPVGRRPGRADQPVRRPAGLDLQRGLREPDARPPER